jgi:hypothetical protein
MHFAFKWKHRDGSTIAFSPGGWDSDDPAKAGWLNQESELLGSWPVIPMGIRAWLQQNCELIDFRAIVQ